MSLLPPGNTPLNQHSLVALESWLNQLGAQKSRKNPCLWIWLMPQWSAEIEMDRDELKVIWEKDGKLIKCSFPYGLPRRDVQNGSNTKINNKFDILRGKEAIK